MLDAVAPALMLGYGIGRLGCQIAGDGDWGIEARMALKPAWLPDWLWAQTYEGNILGVTIPPPGVYPTALYEFAAAPRSKRPTRGAESVCPGSSSTRRSRQG